MKFLLVTLLVLVAALVVYGNHHEHVHALTKSKAWWKKQNAILHKTKKEEALILRSFPCKHVNVTTSTEDRVSLENFFHSTDGQNWINNTGWMKGDPCTDMWFGVCCSDSGRVTEINLPSNFLLGQLPQFISSLDALQALRLYDNSISGTIPTDIYEMKSMQVLDLENNRLEGSLPDSLSMPQLTNLSLANNMLEGFLPTNWNTPKLRVVSLSANKFQGPLPPNIGALTDLERLDLSNNILSGSLPSDYGKLASLQNLWLFVNQFNRAEIPNSWSGMVNLKNIQMDALKGSMPEWIGKSWKHLEVLIFVNGNLTGSLPSSICDLNNIQYFHIFYNNISGEIPICICNLPAYSLLSIDISNNQLTGTIPGCLGNLQNLFYIYLENNNLHGQLPSSLGNLKHLYSLDVSTNSLYGPIPSSFSALKSTLNQFGLGNNKLNGFSDGLESFFDQIATKSCDLYGNPFPCPIPSYVPQNCNARCNTCNTGDNRLSCQKCTANDYCGWCNEGLNCLNGYGEDGPGYPYHCKQSNWYYGKNPHCPPQ